ncbi:MAG TPA: S-adenosylmethionine:tRNA ribosyltransferase-isomerase [Micromonosporaceae bacterium]|nr:S-adenosylmethionine:tRNA ribosyltransferase-isomerase [Micromonosporaceae bacterium]
MTVAALGKVPSTSFKLADERSATEPPEARGLARDQVRLLVAEPGRVAHARFRDLGRFLRAGDLVVVNTSATLPAAVDGTRADGSRVVVHCSTPLDGRAAWVVELRLPDGSGPVRDASAGERVELPGGAVLTLLSAYPDERVTTGSRLWAARAGGGATGGDVSGGDVSGGGLGRVLARHGRPITYGYLRGRWPLRLYQPVFGRKPGSAEMASAGRPFTHRLVTDLVTRGVAVAPVLLHAGVSSLEAYEPPQPERFRVPLATARLVTQTRRWGGRVVAVGTTVVRALESAAQPDGSVVPAGGWTDLVLGPDRPARVVGGLVTGWHAPDASHLLLLEAVAGAELVGRAYGEALRAGYRWHEFGDSCLLLPADR